MTYIYYTSLCTPRVFPVTLLKHNLILPDGTLFKIEQGQAYPDEWGGMQTFMADDGTEYPLPCKLDLDWIAIAEQKHYSLQKELDLVAIENLWEQTDDDGFSIYTHFALNIAPFGQVALWLHGPTKQILIGWWRGQEESPNVKLPLGFTLQSFCHKVMTETIPEVRENLIKNGLPKPYHYDKLMEQYYYRMTPRLARWMGKEKRWEEYDEEDEKMPVLDYVEAKCIDGTYDRLRNGSLQYFHHAGLPSLIDVYWHVGKRQYSAYFFFKDQEKLADLLRRITMMSLEEKVDFELRMDPEQERFVVCLNNGEMGEPMELTDSIVDVMVFRNRLECYRNPNYSQPKGAWQW